MSKKKSKKAEKTYTIGLELSEGVFYKEMSEINVRKVLTLPIEDRYMFIVHNSKAVALYSNDFDLYVDASGNQTDKEFWENDGEYEWRQFLEE